MDLRRIRYFVAIAEEGSFSGAAQRLYVAQPALSQQIHRLESDLGVSLFDRSTRPMTLTPAGTALLGPARSLLRNAEELTEISGAAAQGRVGRLRIGIVPSALFGPATALIRDYIRTHPQVEVSVHEANTTPLLTELKTGATDVVIMRADPGLDGLSCLTIDVEPLVAALPADHPAAASTEVGLDILRDDRLVMFAREPAPHNVDAVLAACVLAGISPRVVTAPGGYPIQVGYVASGLGIALVPRSMRCVHHEGVTYRPLTAPHIDIATTLVWRTHDTSPTVGRLTEMAEPAEARGG